MRKIKGKRRKDKTQNKIIKHLIRSRGRGGEDRGQRQKEQQEM